MQKIYKEMIEDLKEIGVSNFLKKYNTIAIGGTSFEEESKKIMAWTYEYLEEGTDFHIIDKDLDTDNVIMQEKVGYGSSIHDAIIDLIEELDICHIMIGEDEDEEDYIY